MEQNELAISSDRVSNNTSSLMDPLNRVLPFHRASPDSQLGGGVGDRDLNSADVPGRSANIHASENAEMDEILVDEMVRDLDLGLGVESLEDDSFENAANHDESDSCGATEDDFAAIGVRNLEWRLPIIRSAAHRSADAIASSQLVDPTASQEAQLTKIVLSTYRLIDPRFRGSYFQQVRVGRMLPMALQTASCVDGTPPSLQPMLWNDQRNAVRLFGHAIPLRAATQITQPAQHSKRELRQATKKISRRDQGRVQVRSNYRAEAMEVLAELQSRPHSTKWTHWLHGRRLVVSLCGLLALSMLSMATYRIAAPLVTPAEPHDQLVRQRNENRPRIKPKASVNPGAASPRPLPAESRPVESPSLSGENEVALLDSQTSKPSLPHPSESARNNLDLEIPSPPNAPEIAHRELTTAELMAALAKASGVPEIELKALDNSDGHSVNGPRDKPRTRKPLPGDNPVSGANAGNSVPNPSGVPNPRVPKDSTSLDDAAIESAVATLWSETDSAGRRFTATTVGELIDAWDLTADLAGAGSLENAAAHRLIIQASWLVRPLAQIVRQIRRSERSASARFANASELQLLNTSNLNAEETNILITSWRVARKRVVRTSDLDQMLRQANVLLDRSVISDQLSPRARIDFLATFRNDVEQLARICSDKVSIGETKSLFAAIDTLPVPSEWVRLAAAKNPSGLMASIYCLQQRRWDQGIAWLGQTSNPAVAAAAKSEWKLIQNEQLDAAASDNDANARVTLAKRWSKIADHLEPREAASVRLHAIDLYGEDAETLTQRDELRAELPQYVE